MEIKQWPKYNISCGIVKERKESFIACTIVARVRFLNKEDSKYYFTNVEERISQYLKGTENTEDLLEKQQECISYCFERFIFEVEMVKNFAKVIPLQNPNTLKNLFKLDPDQRSTEEILKEQITF